MFNFNKSILALIAVLTLCSVEARGESFTITDTQGSAFVSTSVDGGPPTLKLPLDFNFSGPGLSISAHPPLVFGGDTGNVQARDTCRMMPCTPGMVLQTNSTFSGILAKGATATVNGVRFDFVTLSGSLNFITDPILIPNRAGGFNVTLPFDFSGEINGDQSTRIFDATLTGHGWATFRFFDNNRDPSGTPFYVLDAIEYRFAPLVVGIDIRPGTLTNSINPRSKGRIAVAILTTPAFDATFVDPETIRFGATGTEAAPVHVVTEDVDGDGDIDLVLHFATQDTGITCGDDTGWLTGAIFEGSKIKGSDSIRTEGCN